MTINELNDICKNSFVDHIGIRFTQFDGERISGEIAIAPHHMQPGGVVHGGVYLSIAETVAGAGSQLMVMNEGKTAYGVTVNSQHIAPVTSGKITASGKLIHKGIFKHTWDIEITDDSGKLISISRVTNSIKPIEKDIDKVD
jgi:1,4-dihydroxy-2-naphthoyl-CoA hydrolase